MRKNKVFDFWFRKQYIIAGTLVLAATCGLTALYSYNQEQEKIRMEQDIAAREEQSQLAEEEQEIDVEKVSSVIPPKSDAVADSAKEQMAALNEETILGANDIIEGQIELPEVLAEAPENVAEVAPLEEEAPVSVKQPDLHFSEESELMWPMEGNVIMNFNMDSTVYHATLDQYKYNPAIIIAGAVNDKVYAAAKGKITGITQNEETGTTVTVDLGNGYQAIYGQLKELNFKEGDYLEAGHVIGYVSEPTKYYSVEGSNLYFELQKDGTPIDPITYFAE